MQLPVDPESIRGFLHPDEGWRLFELALDAAVHGPCLEVGSYCGKSTVYLGTACRERGQLLFAVDHHRGSEEHQPGEAYHDPTLLDVRSGRVDSLPLFRETLERAGLEDTVVPLVTTSALASRHWLTPLSLVFIDGGHSREAALTDYRAWAPHVRPGGFLAIHDLFPDPADGGQAPIEIYRLALASGLYAELPGTRTLGVLQRIG
ncbi:MAG TPA: class I SAM-dependent methyltransferase [Pseudomonadales bacterium]